MLDVRTPGEFENRHIAGAYNVPLDQLAEHAPELRAVSGGLVILVCQSGQRANRAEALLHQAGMTDTCAMGMLLARLPYNRASSCDTASIVRRFVAADKAGLQ